MFDDAELLDRYAQSRDEHAFEELVARYLNIVYSAALRHLGGDVHHAQDVAQNVFRDLARKAPSIARNLHAGQPLLGWLYTSTHHAAASLRRTEQRRQSHEHAAHTMNEALQPTSPKADPAWSDLRPLLDEAMNKLAQPDRDAVLLRYFAGKDLRSVGIILRSNEDAVRKRIDRALDRLHLWFSHRGIKTTAAALAAAVSTHAVQNAPAGFAASLARTVLTSVGANAATINSGIGLKALFSTHPAVIVSAAAGIVLVGTLVYRASHQKQSKDVVGPPSAVMNVGAAAGVPTGYAVSSPPPNPPLIPSDSTVHSGSEASDSFRVPKSLLGNIPVRALTIPDDETRGFVVEETFAQLAKMTPQEVTRVNSILAESLHRYRIEEGRHLKLIDDAFEDPLTEPKELKILLIEKFNYRLTPFPKEARAIRQKLDDDILQVLGQERAKFFQEKGAMVGSEMNTFTEEDSPQSGTTNSTVFIFRLTDRERGPIVDQHRVTFSQSKSMRSAGGHGFDCGAPLDQYAPESIKPILARWRKWIDEHPPKSTPVPLDRTHLGIPALGIPTQQIGTSVEEFPEWDENSLSINLSKSLVDQLKIVGLTEDEGVSAEAMELCKLTQLEADAIRVLYAGMKARFLQMEREHFGKSGPANNSFVLRAFPKENASLQAEWRGHLQQMLGDGRDELLDRLIRNPASPSELERRERLRRVGPPRDWFREGPEVDWLKLGASEVMVEITEETTGSSERLTRRVTFRPSDHSNGSFTFTDPKQIPVRWRHLLTPEILRAR